ncbi:MAG: glycoside hydrolase family 125 protein [Lentisphaeria bacterium]|jgi:hypothetical protein
MTFPSRRPAAGDRCFQNATIETVLAETKARIRDAELAWLFGNCFPNTLDTTVRHGVRDGRPDTFVITGDIPAMWLRDSTAQVWPYVRYAGQDPALRDLLLGVIHRQAASVRLDPYANAFNPGPTGSHWASDRTEMRPELHERKWELDSLCYVLRLAHGYWQATGDTGFMDAAWLEAAGCILATFRQQQRFAGAGPYRFQRLTEQASDTLPLGGAGYPVNPCGLIASAFRPSDDACLLHFLIPANFFAVTALRQLAALLDAAGTGAELARDARALATQVETELAAHAVVPHPRHGAIWAYEADGFGSHLLMDDANAPSLLSLPYLGCCPADAAIYRRTRAFVLGPDNPFFFKGAHGEGVGGPHVGMGMAWPMSVVMRALTSRDEAEIAACLAQLKHTHAGTGFMHEAFDVAEPARFTRPWFAWANTLFGELIVTLAETAPDLLAREY